MLSNTPQNMFSKVACRLHGETNPLYQLRDEIVRGGCEIIDLTSGNVGEQGILFPQPLLENLLIEAARRSRVYKPDSFGQLPARVAISEYYRAQNAQIPPQQILLTPGTSIAYWYCFKLLADEGDEIVCPRPSYPLFDYLAAMSGVRMSPYRLDDKRGWAIDLEHLENSISTRTRALVLISPHNPTGRVATEEEVDALAEWATRHDLAIISDEVFNEFLIEPGTLPRPASRPAPLVLTLNGFSKMFALPGIKLGWMAVSGEPSKVRVAMRALELISDTFLPVNETVQAAVPDIFQEGGSFLSSYVNEIRTRWEVARGFLEQCNRVSFVKPDGGFYATLRIERDEEAVAEQILSRTHILVHPGYFYDIDPNHLVFSYVLNPERLRDVLPRILAQI